MYVCMYVCSLLLCVQDASCNPLCRRLALTELLPTAWQRLTKYPLLIEKLLSCTCMLTAVALCLENQDYLPYFGLLAAYLRK